MKIISENHGPHSQTIRFHRIVNPISQGHEKIPTQYDAARIIATTNPDRIVKVNNDASWSLKFMRLLEMLVYINVV